MSLTINHLFPSQEIWEIASLRRMIRSLPRLLSIIPPVKDSAGKQIPEHKDSKSKTNASTQLAIKAKGQHQSHHHHQGIQIRPVTI